MHNMLVSFIVCLFVFFSDLSMPKPPLPFLGDFVPGEESYRPPNTESATTSFAAVPPIVHVYNLWFNGDKGDDIAPVYRTVEEDTPPSSQTMGLTFKTELIIFVVFMAIIDFLWLVHRLVKAYRVSRLLLCGYPLYVDCSENKGKSC